MRTLVAFLLIALLLMSSTVVVAQRPDNVPPARVDICHLDEDGNFRSMSIVEKALNAHLAHGDLVIGVDIDANCEYPVLGCFPGSWDGSYGYVDYGGLNAWPAETTFGLFASATCEGEPDFYFSYGIPFVYALDDAIAEYLCFSHFGLHADPHGPGELVPLYVCNP